MHDILEAGRPRRAVLVAVQLPGTEDGDLRRSLDELGRLARTLGVIVVGELTQKRDRLDPGQVVGKGKLGELQAVINAGADLVIVDHEISPSQLSNLERETGADALDRTGLIIEIFHRHARSRAARAQVEIVRLSYLAPRLREQAAGKGERQRSSGVSRTAGESRLELDRRKIRDRIAELQLELGSLEDERETRRARRRELNRVALVGYTNAGKSTLMRALTGSDVYVADKLFATLDTTVRVIPSSHPRVLLSDTVGFIEKLPHGLVASFKSTLDEAIEASLLVHVVDAADPAYPQHLQVTEQVLAEIGAGDIPRLLVLNKADRLDAEAVASVARRHPEALIVSAMDPGDVTRLREAFQAFFVRDLVETEVRLGWDQQSRKAEIFERCLVLEEKYDEHGVVLRLKAPADMVHRDPDPSA
jgi:GTP-binding protein HflX